MPPAERLDPLSERPELALKRLGRRLEPAAIVLACALGLVRIGAARQVAGDDQLSQGRALDVVVSLLGDDPLEHRAARRDPAGAQPAADRLRERIAIDHVRRSLGTQRARIGALESQVTVDPVLE